MAMPPVVGNEFLVDHLVVVIFLLSGFQIDSRIFPQGTYDIKVDI